MHKTSRKIVAGQVILIIYGDECIPDNVVAHPLQVKGSFDNEIVTVDKPLKKFSIGQVKIGIGRKDLLVIPEDQVLVIGKGFDKQEKSIRFFFDPAELIQGFGMQNQFPHQGRIRKQALRIPLLFLDIALQLFPLVVNGRLHTEVVGGHKRKQEQGEGENDQAAPWQVFMDL